MSKRKNLEAIAVNLFRHDLTTWSSRDLFVFVKFHAAGRDWTNTPEDRRTQARIWRILNAIKRERRVLNRAATPNTDQFSAKDRSSCPHQHRQMK